MQALDYWKAVIADRSGFLERLLAVLRDSRVRDCVIGGQAVNAYAYVEPVVSLDLDVAVAAEDLPSAEAALAGAFRVERFPHRVPPDVLARLL